MQILTLVVITLVIVALIDVITRDDSQVRHLPKMVWIILVALLPLIGSILWFTLGREYSDAGIRMPRRSRPSPQPSPAPPSRPVDTRSTEQQLADLEREIEEWRLREEIAKRKRERGETS